MALRWMAMGLVARAVTELALAAVLKVGITLVPSSY